MNYGAVISAIEFAIEHRQEIAADLECAVHLIRRIEHACVKHDTTADSILVAVDKALEMTSEPQNVSVLTGTAQLKRGSSSTDG